jgi:hypothetical protein
VPILRLEDDKILSWNISSAIECCAGQMFLGTGKLRLCFRSAPDPIQRIEQNGFFERQGA